MKSVNNRLLFNRAILNRLHYVVENNPDLRFGQILTNCDIITGAHVEGNKIVVIDPFYEESEVTWNKMCKNKFCFQE